MARFGARDASRCGGDRARRMIDVVSSSETKTRHRRLIIDASARASRWRRRLERATARRALIERRIYICRTDRPRARRLRSVSMGCLARRSVDSALWRFGATAKTHRVHTNSLTEVRCRSCDAHSARDIVCAQMVAHIVAVAFPAHFSSAREGASATAADRAHRARETTSVSMCATRVMIRHVKRWISSHEYTIRRSGGCGADASRWFERWIARSTESSTESSAAARGARGAPVVDCRFTLPRQKRKSVEYRDE